MIQPEAAIFKYAMSRTETAKSGRTMVEERMIWECLACEL